MSCLQKLCKYAFHCILYETELNEFSMNWCVDRVAILHHKKDPPSDDAESVNLINTAVPRRSM